MSTSAAGVSPDQRTEGNESELENERDYLAFLYRHLDEQREATQRRLKEILIQDGRTPGAVVERDAAYTMQSDRLAQLRSVDYALCFGRLDMLNNDRFYVGRLGLFDPDNDYEPLLIDWRAPAAQPFYTATAATPAGVRRRRHIRMRGRAVTGIDDEVLDLDSLDDADRSTLNGEGALLAALNANRTGAMSDIVATIQAEQDAVIRADANGVLVVQGGPGTGKTAVALHRAAYLLYTHRNRLRKQGVLVLGPNATFVRYIADVLPSLGETDVLLSDLGDLLPGLTATGVEPPRVAAVKGRAAMAKVIAAAVRDRQELPEVAIELKVDGYTLRLNRQTVAKARDRARNTRQLHNVARANFARQIIRALGDQFARKLGDKFLQRGDMDDIRGELRDDPSVIAAIDHLWPMLTPERLLTDLYASDQRLVAAAPRFSPADRALLRREPGSPWTPADVPLLDEAAEVLGEDTREAERQAAHARAMEIAYAEGVLEIMTPSDHADEEVLQVTDVFTASALASRHHSAEYETTAERAAADRQWTFGHVIVDEAQELSPMAWRAVMRRCPSRSMTVVGDISQRSVAAGAGSWDEVMRPYVRDRWRLAELTVNYRTPDEIMAVAADVLAEVSAGATAPRSVRSTGVPPWHRQASADTLSGELVKAVEAELSQVGDGTLAVIAPAALVAELSGLLVDALPQAFTAPPPSLARAAVMTASQSKGLEFDAVLVVEPQAIVAESEYGGNDLYVSLTRPTQRLGVLHSAPLPPALSGLSAYDPTPV
ncbi:HelD family protein [Fodinicola acaciae]|uniref:HelD family protein n=1 Tax=Fodinicola acaciae TaxID=2681555 RepID=UPI0013D5DCC2|nr:helicase [Fodinicola acaciae]